MRRFSKLNATSSRKGSWFFVTEPQEFEIVIFALRAEWAKLSC